jgi:hypothetical protein
VFCAIGKKLTHSKRLKMGKFLTYQNKGNLEGRTTT